MPTNRKPKTCPHCGSSRVAEILYGMIALIPELLDQMNRGEVTLGGCCLSGEDPSWKCLDCNKQFGVIRRRFREN